MAHPLAEIKNFNYDTLNKELGLSTAEKQWQCLLDAYLGDFWQKGSTLLPPTQGGTSSTLDKLLERRYVFRNVIREVVGRVVGGFYGKAPNWRFQRDGEILGKEDLEEGLTRTDKALGKFFVKQNVLEEMGKAFAFRLAFGRGSWRLYIPTKYKRLNRANSGPAPDVGTEGSQEFVKFASIEEAIAAMRVEFIPPTQARLLDDGGELFSLVKYETRSNWETQDKENVIEFSFVDNSARTFIGTLKEHGGVSNILEANLSSPFDLGGYTTLGEFNGQPYVNEALYRNNQLVNLALTCAGFSLVDNGFGEMILTNVQLETRTVTGPDGALQEVPVDIIRGGGAVQNFVGLDTIDEQGTVTKGTPGVTFREPPALTSFKDGYDLGYAACLQEAGQLYALISGDATASGESRIQALSDFVLRINPYKAEVDAEGSQLMTVALRWAAQLSGTPLPNYSIAYDSRMFVASLSGAEKTQVMEMRKAGVISRETERVLLGIDDPELENEIILREEAEPIDTTTMEDLSERADVGLKLQGLGLSQDLLFKIVGLTDQEIAAEAKRTADYNASLQEQIRLAQQG